MVSVRPKGWSSLLSEQTEGLVFSVSGDQKVGTVAAEVVQGVCLVNIEWPLSPKI